MRGQVQRGDAPGACWGVMCRERAQQSEQPASKEARIPDAAGRSSPPAPARSCSRPECAPCRLIAAARGLVECLKGKKGDSPGCLGSGRRGINHRIQTPPAP